MTYRLSNRKHSRNKHKIHGTKTLTFRFFARICQFQTWSISKSVFSPRFSAARLHSVSPASFPILCTYIALFATKVFHCRRRGRSAIPLPQSSATFSIFKIGDFSRYVSTCQGAAISICDTVWWLFRKRDQKVGRIGFWVVVWSCVRPLRFTGHQFSV